MPSVGSSERGLGHASFCGTNMLLIPQGYQVVELKFMVFTGLADSKTVAMHAAEICVFMILLSCRAPAV